MRRLLAIAAILGTSVATYAQTSTPAVQPSVVCLPGDKSDACSPSPKKIKQAKKIFTRALHASKKGDLTKALELYSDASRLAPQNPEYITARELTRQQLVFGVLDKGNRAMLEGKSIEALAAFRTAVDLDPTNEFAQQRLRDALPPLPKVRVDRTTAVDAAGTVRLAPSQARRTIHFRGNSAQLLETVARTFGLVPFVDSSIRSRPVRFDLENATWEQTIAAATRMTKSFWSPLATNQVLFAADDDQNRRALMRMSMTTFYVSNASSPQELNDLTNSLRILFDIRFISMNATQGTITIRAPQPVVEAATQFVEQLEDMRPQVMLDVQVFEISQSLARQVGVEIPLELQVFNLPTAAQQLLGGQNIQDIINQFLQNGTITPEISAAIAGLLGQATSGNSSSLSGTLLTFGGGKTLSGFLVQPSTLRLNANESSLRAIQHVSLRASHANPAIMKIGTRIPVVNATFTSVYSTPALQQLTGNQASLGALPSFNYEDIGVNLKATPLIRRSGDVTVDFELQLRSVSGSGLNGVPIISNREYKGVITSKSGESIIMVGMVSHSEQRSLRGLPLISHVPILGRATSTDNVNNNDTELLVVVTPRILAQNFEAPPIEVPLPNLSPR